MVHNPSLKKQIAVMIVDDSAVVRGLLARELEKDTSILVVSSVGDGEMALSALAKQPVDVVILDVEMPRMNGITALPKILELSPKTKVIMASSIALNEAGVSMRALSLGASDYVVKPSAQRSDKDTHGIFYGELIEKIKALAAGKFIHSKNIGASLVKSSVVPAPIENASPSLPIPAIPIIKYPNFKPSALAIASSTGGPQALLALFKLLQNNLRHVPIFITQHMPANFTTILAENISNVSQRDCHEAKDGEVVVAGKIYVAPGNYHMLPKRKGVEVVISLTQDEPVNFCRPSADPMMDALVEVYGRDVLLAVLTGMGQDGLNGAKVLVDRGGFVVAQDEATSVVWGMPKAVVDANLHSAMLPLDGIASYILRTFGEKAL